MASCRGAARRKQRWCTTQPLTPLMEGPDLEMQHEGCKKESSWEVIREWFRAQRSVAGGSSGFSVSLYRGSNKQYPAPAPAPAKSQDLRLLLGVLACPLAPIPLPLNNSNCNNPIDFHHVPRTIVKDIPIVSLFSIQLITYTRPIKSNAAGCMRTNEVILIGDVLHTDTGSNTT